jgi:hypothetical protein
VYHARWVKTGRARFLIDRGAPPATPPGYARLERWPLPDGGTLAVYVRS